MKYNRIEKEFIKSLVYRQQRLIGAEFELLLVDSKGHVPPLKTVQNIFIELSKQGWQVIKDEEGKQVIGAKEQKENFGINNMVTIDTGYPIFEIVISPKRNLHLVKKEYEQILKKINPIVKKNGINLLSYGIQPLSKPSFKLLSPRPRYKFFVDRYKSTHANMTIIASTQSNMNMFNEKELIKSINVLLALVPIQTVLFENSPVWEGKVHEKYKSIRPMFWYGRNEPWRVGMPNQPFEDLDDYLRTIWSLETFLVRRNKKTYEVIGNPPFNRYLQYGGTGRNLITDKKIKLDPIKEDIIYHNTFVWWDSRVKISDKTVYLENRVASAQPPGEEMSVYAYHLGIIENIDKVWEILKNYRWKDLQDAKFNVLTKTFKTKINNEPIGIFTLKTLKIAKQGLVKRGLGEEKYLEPLFERVEKKESPADKSIKIFNKGKIKGLIDYYTVSK